MEASALRAGRAVGPPRLVLRAAGDERLIARIRAGDDRAFEILFERYERPLLSFCRHMLGRRDEAEDAVQQAFLSAFTALRRSGREINVRPWLFTIARNQCLSMLRARRDPVPLEDAEPAVEGLSAEVARREDLRFLLADLAALPEDQRAALVLAELGALAHDEIAAVLGCRREKVKALVFQARSTLGSAREARETPCAEIREQLATLTGGALRRAGLRRHVRDCDGCRAFGGEVRRQRREMAVLLPVVPGVGLKAGVLAGTGISSSVAAGAVGGTAAGAGGFGAALLGLGTTKLAVSGLIVAGLGAGGVTAAGELSDHHSGAVPAASPSLTTSPATPGRAVRQGTALLAAPRAGSTTEGVAAGLVGARPTAPGRSELAPGQAGRRAPGRSATKPSGPRGPQRDTSPGRSGTSPGSSGATPSTPPGSGGEPSQRGQEDAANGKRRIPGARAPRASAPVKPGEALS